MKNIIFFTTLLLTAQGIIAQQNYKFKFKVKGAEEDTVAYLANYYGKSQYYNDTAVVNSKGELVFEGKSKPGGIYSVVLQDKKSIFQLVIAENEIHMETAKPDLTGNMKIKNSPENKAFYEYMRMMNQKQPAIAQLIEKRDNTEDANLKKDLKKQIDEKTAEIEEWRDDFFQRNEGKFIHKVLIASKDPEIPEEVKNDADSTAQYRYYRDNYFKYVDLSDDRLIRTPILHNKIDYYITKLTPQVPDSICKAAKSIISQTEGDSSLIFKYVVQHVTNVYEKSKMMGMDAVFVCMAEEYYMKGKAFWLDSAQFESITDHYTKRKRQIVGVQAENLILPTPEGEWTSMHDIDKDYTVLIFWDPKCGHCKRELPKIKKFHDEWGDDVAVFSVSTSLHNEDWEKFINDKELHGFINVSDNPDINKEAATFIQSGVTTYNSLNFRDFWDIYSTPQLYILDKDKKIIAKRLGAEQLADFISQHKKQSGTKSEGDLIQMEVVPEGQ